ncbi:MAG: SDR family oxidoreductase [Oscillospiraceae bacterium]|nr:SDR family oxidoreductase [Oscillospiraceae bacterium]
MVDYLRYDKLLAGKTAWITGGAEPPYDAYARLFSEHGADIVLVGGRPEDGEKLCNELRQGGGGNAEHQKCDLYDADMIEALCGHLLAGSNAPDVFLHVADMYHAAYIDELDYSNMERMLAISVTAPFAVVKCIAAPMAAVNGGGSIIIVGGHYGVQGMNRASGYGAAKGGEISLAYSLAMEYAADNIRVNAIVPGASFPPVGEDLLAMSGEGDTPDFWGTVQPFRRRGRMGELANAALFLASGMSSYITGEALLVNGAEHLIAHNHNFPRKDRPLP